MTNLVCVLICHCEHLVRHTLEPCKVRSFGIFLGNLHNCVKNILEICLIITWPDNMDLVTFATISTKVF